MRVLEINDEAKAKVMRVRNFAEQKVNWYYGHGPVPGDNPRYVCHLNDFRCVFTLTVGDSGLHYRHLSISVPSENYPHPAAAWTIAELFGFTGWDGRSFDKVPADWAAIVNPEEHCVVLAQEIKKEQVQ